MEGRYDRQIRFTPISKHGQELLEAATVTIIGCGALGTTSLTALARSGVGEIHLVDRDYVELTNLHRQQLFTEQDAREMMPKVIAAKQRIQSIRSDLEVIPYVQHADAHLIDALAQKSDLIIDGTDNFETRMIINDVSYKRRVPWIHGACIGSSGTVFPFIPNDTPCFRCLLPVLPTINDTCTTTGIISMAVQMTAAIQCAEALKWLTDNKPALRKKVHHFDVWNNEQIDIDMCQIQSSSCQTCGVTPIYPALTEARKFVQLCGGDTVQISPDQTRRITMNDAEKVAQHMHVQVKKTAYFITFSVYDQRIIVFADGRILLHGVNNIEAARKLYIKVFG